MEIISLTSRSQDEFIDITERVQRVVTSAGTLNNGYCMLFVPHTTAGITINESADPSVKSDILMMLSALVLREAEYRHMEGNSAAHVKSTLVGASQLVAIEHNRLVLGTWQGIFFCEFDGPRNRKVHVHLFNS
ncbi:MAG: secondary thiamine-phosphate synthase enzyme YjbQ [Desulfatirhabdiaceae bacterium]|nr:secondary thiamine-phosphate synthase enzyme YjbQ [Desulfatirhabdiaceae bacterium]